MKMSLTIIQENKNNTMVNCNLSNNKVFYFPPHKINNYLSLKKDPLRGRHIHTKNKYNYFIQIAIFDRFARGAS